MRISDWSSDVCSSDLIAAAGASLGRFDARPWLGDIDVPVAVVRTTRDNVVSPTRQHELAAAIPHAQVIDIAADHAACVTGASQIGRASCRASVCHYV